jgi:hypothetical protein
MRRWKEVGSVESHHSRDHSELDSNRSSHNSPFRSFHQSLENKSATFLNDKDKTFCYEYVQRYRERGMTLTYEMRSEKNGKNGGKEDMFTSMRQALKEDSVP